MTALDASILVAILDANDAHHETARRHLRQTIEAGLTLSCSPITLAEVLVGPARRGELATGEQRITRLGVEVVPLPANAAPTLARLRAETGLRLPDCCVLLAASQDNQALITFDDRLAKAARRLGLTVGTA